MTDLTPRSTRSPRRRAVVLATVCLAVFAINLDTTIVNVALPSLTRQLGAGTRSLQWVVDGYNLAFAALVLAAGTIGDRFGRRPALLIGLVGFAAAAALGSAATSSGELIAVRVVMGAFAALIYPTTLSVITNVYPERTERTRAIGVWGAVTGLGVAVGPVTGGLLLAHFWWGSVFLALVPAALLAAGLSAAFVPESRQHGAPRLDWPGLLSASAAVGVLVDTVIEAPGRGWTAPASLAGFAAAALLLAGLVALERRAAHPMLDVRVFRSRAFSAASASVTIAFFALFGFIFVITQYMQVVRGFGTLSTGARILPVASTIAVGSVLGAQLAPRVGTRRLVVTGLVLLAASFGWIAASSTYVSYGWIVVQMGLIGTGLGLTTTPATESIMSVLPPAKAGVGSAINDATRETGGTLGVAVIGSVYSSLYLRRLLHSPIAHLPAPLLAQARSSVGAAMTIAGRAGSASLTHAASSAFMTGMRAGCLVAAAVCLAGAVGALALPGRPPRVSAGVLDSPGAQVAATLAGVAGAA